jgi:hypothetical protein
MEMVLDGRARSPKMVSVGMTFATAFTRPVFCWHKKMLARYTTKRQLNRLTSIHGGDDYSVFLFIWAGIYRVDLSTCWMTIQGTFRATIVFRGGCGHIVFIIGN